MGEGCLGWTGSGEGIGRRDVRVGRVQLGARTAVSRPIVKLELLEAAGGWAGHKMPLNARGCLCLVIASLVSGK